MKPAGFDESDLLAVLRPMEPYLDQIVVCGGWTLVLYRRWVLKDGGPLPMATMDLDLAVPAKVGVAGRTLDQLLLEAGFRENFIGREGPAISYIKEGAPEIEFLTPRKGDRPAKAIEVQPGLRAEPLRFLEVVLENTRLVEIPEAGLEVRVPTPEAYVYQKGLSFPRRRSEAKKAKDLAYLFELLKNFPALSSVLPQGLCRLRENYPARWFRTFKENLVSRFGDADAEGVDMVAGQRPHPHDAMVTEDPVNGAARFRRVVLEAFRVFLNAL